jgi:nucleoside-diphosphate-sugar epimerase
LAALVLGVGYIGSALVRYLVDRGERVVGLDNLFSTDTDALDRLVQTDHGRFRLLIGDTLSPADLDLAFEAARPEAIVYNLAAQSSADPTAAPASLTEEVNLRGPRLVLEAAARHRARAVVYASSARVLGPSLPALLTEPAPLGRIGDLSHLSKVYAEKLHEMHSASSGLACASVRLGLAYGLAPVMKRDYIFMTAPNKFCLRALRCEPLVVQLGGPVGLIHVADAAAALAAAAGLCRTGESPAWNAISDARTIEDVAGVVVAAAAERGFPVSVEARGQREPAPFVDLGPSALRAGGFVPRYSLEEGVLETLDHFFRLGRGA